MKKVFLIVATLLALSFTSRAQEFEPGWNFQLKGGVDFCIGESLDFFKLMSPTASLSAGYKFTPVFGVRGDLSGWQTKVMQAGFEKFNFMQLSADAVIDLIQLFSDTYKPRVFNMYFLAGVGANYRFNNDNVAAAMAAGPHVWDGSVIGAAGRLGGGIDIFVSKALAINLEAVTNVVPDDFNSVGGGLPDINNYLTVGLKYDLSRKKSVEAHEAAVAAAAAAAAKAAAEKAAAEKAAADKAAADKAAAEAAAKEAAEKAAAEKAAAEQAAAARAEERKSSNNVLFLIGQTNIRKNQESYYQAVIDKLNAYPDATVVVSGYADKETGSAKRNMQLSKQRAENVAKLLIKNGISEDRITTEYYGSEVNPFDTPAENRVAVCTTR